jgi:hypothetical protein
MSVEIVPQYNVIGSGSVKEVCDEKPATSDRLPYIEELRASQAKGNVGIGLNEESYVEMQQSLNRGAEIKDTDDNPTTGRV